MDQDWSDDELAPYDSAAGTSMFENVTKFGSDNADAYSRMIEEQKPPEY